VDDAEDGDKFKKESTFRAVRAYEVVQRYTVDSHEIFESF
jgi:hypothetical protein